MWGDDSQIFNQYLKHICSVKLLNGDNTIANLTQLDEGCIQCVIESYGVPKQTPSTCTADICGILGITKGYWIDGGSLNGDYINCAMDATCSKQTWVNYMRKYAKDCNGDAKIDCVDYFRIHMLGAYGCQNQGSITKLEEAFFNCFNKKFI